MDQFLLSGVIDHISSVYQFSLKEVCIVQIMTFPNVILIDSSLYVVIFTFANGASTFSYCSKNTIAFQELHLSPKCVVVFFHSAW